MYDELFEELGMTRNEAKVYMALLKSKSAQAGRITKISGVHRRNVYDALERLIQKGLVSTINKGKQKVFVAEPPERILRIIDDKKALAEEQIPKLRALQQSEEYKQSARVYYGKSGLQTVFDDQVQSGSEVLVYGASLKYFDLLKWYSFQHEKKRIKYGIKSKLIFNETEKPEVRKKSLARSQVKYISKDYSGPAATNIYGNKVAIILWIEPPVAIIIENRELAETYRRYFNLLWKLSKK
ncbi:MAG: helix-turn-helix domain-containing protein [archaeon]